MPIAHEIVARQESRGIDRWGSGEFGASRDQSHRLHQGLDIRATAGEEVYSPIGGIVLREAVPYRDDGSYRGVVIRGEGEWSGYEVKVFYVDGAFCGAVQPGQVVGSAQDLTRRYRGITNHIHVEVRQAGRLLSPQELWQMCL
jgi:hypothetical protein